MHSGPSFTIPSWDSSSTLSIYQNLGQHSHSDYRQRLRDLTLHELTKEGFTPDKPSFLLPQKPHCKGLNVSLSHGHYMSAAAWGPYHVGCDIVLNQRVHPELVARISGPEELKQAPTAAFLWSAKEATFKAISNKVAVLSQIEIKHWQEQAECWTFQAFVQGLPISPSVGQCRTIMKHSCAFFSYNPQLLSS